MEIFENVSVVKIQDEHTTNIIEFFVKKYIDDTISVNPSKDYCDATVLKNGKKMNYEDIVDFIESVEEKLDFDINWDESYFDDGLVLLGEEIFDWFQVLIDNFFSEKMLYKTEVKDDDDSFYTLLIYRDGLPTNLFSIATYLKLSV